MEIINTINDWLWSYLLIALLLVAAVWFTVKTRGVQFRMFGEMIRLLATSGKMESDKPQEIEKTNDVGDQSSKDEEKRLRNTSTMDGYKWSENSEQSSESKEESFAGVSGCGDDSGSFHSGVSGCGDDSGSFHSGVSGCGDDLGSFHSGVSGCGDDLGSFHSGVSGCGDDSGSFHSGVSGCGDDLGSFHSGASGCGDDLGSFHSDVEERVVVVKELSSCIEEMDDRIPENGGNEEDRRGEILSATESISVNEPLKQEKKSQSEPTGLDMYKREASAEKTEEDSEAKTAGELEERDSRRGVSSFQAFAVSIASRVGTGNLAGVATAIAVGGAGAVFWMWVIALLGSASAFIESTLAQLYKVAGKNSFMGGPAYYIQKGLGKRWWAVIFAVLITITFGLAFNSVQSNTMTAAAKVSFGWDPTIVGAIITVMTLVVIFGGIHRISRFSEIVVPVMAIAYILLAVTVIGMNITKLPEVFSQIVSEAFTGSAALGGGMGSALMMGIKRGLFSNEAGEGSAPNVAATAAVSHPVKQGLMQTFAVFTDTLLICTCTALIILFSGVIGNGESGIALTQSALEAEVGKIGSTFVAVAVFLFAFTSIVSNYYYGETNLLFISKRRWLVPAYRLLVGAVVMVGAVTSLDMAWAAADICMGLMTLCNLLAIFLLGKYAFILLKDYTCQRRDGRNPVYRSSTIPEIASETECWD